RAEQPLALESGESLSDVTLAYRTWGRLNDTGDNVVLICHALTGSADADVWWPGLIAEGGALDPSRDFIVCSNVIAGCYGSSGPYTKIDGDHRQRYGLRFPQVSVRDMVAAQRLLLESLGVRRINLVLGPSLGGMQTLEWAATYPEWVQAIAPIGTSARHSAWCIGISEAQRAALAADPNWQQGCYSDDRRPEQGLAAARMMAMVSYRSFDNFEQRFARRMQDDETFSIQSYLRYKGEKLVGRFDAASYFRLTQAMDTHDVGRGRDGTANALRRIQCPALVVSVSSDVLYPPVEQRFIAEHLPHATFRQLDSEHGHDGFLIDTDELATMLKHFRTGGLAQLSSYAV
ncbi:MAG: homoserine O-acetyltransferase, partial [Pseudomonadota bacterium]